MALEKILKNSSGVPTGEYERIAGGTLYADSPIGTILAFGGADAPAGWMICDGTSLLRASYPELFAVIGTAFGSADSTHFNIPDMRESVPKGAGLTGHTVGAHLEADGLAVGEFLDDKLQSHNHRIRGSAQNLNMSFHTENTTGELAGFTYKGVQKQNEIAARDIFNGRSGDTTEVKSVGVNYIIKAKMIGVPADFLSAVEQSMEDVYGDIIPSDASASNKLATIDKTTVAYQKTQTIASNGDWQEACQIFNVPVGTYLATVYRSTDVSANLQTPDLSSIAFNWADGSRSQSVVVTIATAGKVDIAVKGVSGNSYDFKLVLEKVSDAHTTASYKAVGLGMTTSSVTSGSTAPITSGGVWDKIKYDVEQVGWFQTNGGNSSTLTIPNGRFFFYFIEYESGGSIAGCGIIFRFWSETANPTISQINSASGLSLSLSGNTLTGTATTGAGYYRLRLFGIKS